MWGQRDDLNRLQQYQELTWRNPLISEHMPHVVVSKKAEK